MTPLEIVAVVYAVGAIITALAVLVIQEFDQPESRAEGCFMPPLAGLFWPIVIVLWIWLIVKSLVKKRREH